MSLWRFRGSKRLLELAGDQEQKKSTASVRSLSQIKISALDPIAPEAIRKKAMIHCLALKGGKVANKLFTAMSSERGNTPLISVVPLGSMAGYACQSERYARNSCGSKVGLKRSLYRR